MQKITIIGRLGRDAVVRETQEGRKVISFPVAVNGYHRGVEKTSWYEVMSFNYERYKNMLKYLTKGSNIIIIGELDADVENGSDGVARCRRYVMADSIEFNSNGISGSTTTTQVEEKSPIKTDVVDAAPVITRKKATPKPVETVDDVSVDTSDDLPDDDLPF